MGNKLPHLLFFLFIFKASLRILRYEKYIKNPPLIKMYNRNEAIIKMKYFRKTVFIRTQRVKVNDRM